MIALKFKPIDLARHQAICLRFEADMEACNSGDGSEDAERGALFLDKIAAKLANDPQSCLHAWHAGEIVGQLHLGRFFDETVGYVHFFYVAPAWRGTGVAAQLDAYALRHFTERGYSVARLSVMLGNRRAHRFYRRQDWKDLEPRADKPGAIAMERSF